MKKTVWKALPVALLCILSTVLIAGAQSEPDSAGGTATLPEPQSTPIRLNLIEDLSGTQFLDLKDNGEGPGDMYLWNQNPLIDAQTGEGVGTSSGMCINTVVDIDRYAAECTWTFVLDDGVIYAAGTSDSDGELLIIGGTGAYADASGSMRERYLEETDEYEYTIFIGTPEETLVGSAFELVEDKSGTTVVDLGVVGNSPGDMFLWNQNPLTDAATGMEVGSSSGYCIVTRVVETDFAYECTWTLALEEGSLLVSGTSYDEGDLGILSGTGEYAGATGVLTEFYDEERNQFTYSIRLNEAAELPAAVPTAESATETEGGEDGVRTPEEDVAAFWRDLDWSELTVTERELWGMLGWDRASWNGLAAEPASARASWSELNDVERATARRLGYDQGTWDAARSQVATD